jgi:membrane protease YdiL (CAAX protease family)
MASPRGIGPVATLVWFLGALAPLTIGTILAIFLWIAVNPAIEIGGASSFDPATLESNGALLAIYTVIGDALVLFYLWLIVRRTRIPMTEYFALRLPARNDLALGLVLIAVYLPLADLITIMSGREIVPAFMVDTYRTAAESGFMPLFLFSLIIVAPAAEEMMFRGFLFRGLESGWGATAAILVSGVLFAVIHTQYEWFLVFQIVVVAFLFGWLRARSNSLLLTMLLHAIMNAYASAQVVLIYGAA